MSTDTKHNHSAPPMTRDTKPVRCIPPTLQEVRRQLLASPYAAIKQLRTEFYEGVLVLRGKVPTFYTRQVAIALVMKIGGVEQVDDRIVVDKPVSR